MEKRHRSEDEMSEETDEERERAKALNEDQRRALERSKMRFKKLEILTKQLDDNTERGKHRLGAIVRKYVRALILA